MFYVFTVICALIAFPNDLIAIKVQSSSYKAAVVEHVPIMSHTENVTQQQALEIMNSNLDIYEVNSILVIVTILATYGKRTKGRCSNYCIS